MICEFLWQVVAAMLGAVLGLLPAAVLFWRALRRWPRLDPPHLPTAGLQP